MASRAQRGAVSIDALAPDHPGAVDRYMAEDRRNERGNAGVKVLGGVVLLAAVGAVMGGDESSSSSPSYSDSPSGDQPSSAPAPAPATPVSAEQLLTEFEANEVRAVQTWKGKRVEITGLVDSVGLDFMDDPVVNIGTGKDFEILTIMCNPSNGDRAAQLNKGEPITVTATIKGEIMGTPHLDDCSIK